MLESTFVYHCQHIKNPKSVIHSATLLLPTTATTTSEVLSGAHEHSNYKVGNIYDEAAVILRSSHFIMPLIVSNKNPRRWPIKFNAASLAVKSVRL